MSQPVKLSDALVLDARLAGQAQERSIAGQVEFWARLGRSVELLLNGREVLALRRNAEIQPLSEALASVDTPAGRERLEKVLANRPYPHFRQSQDRSGLLIRIDEDGTETIGRFVNRNFVAMEAKRGKLSKPGRNDGPPLSALTGSQAVPSRASHKPKHARPPKERKAWS
jgi:ParD-like antitoxin of type II bacterial toxin-antitoxin system